MARNFTFQKSLRLSVPVEDLRALHHSAEAIPQLTPPFVQIRVEGDPAIRDGNLQTIKSRVWPTPWQTWKARISEVGPNGFTDTAEQSPFQFFRHRHSFIAHGEGCELIDAIEFRAPGGWLGNQVARLMLTLLFAYRHVVTKRSLTRARS